MTDLVQIGTGITVAEQRRQQQQSDMWDMDAEHRKAQQARLMGSDP